MKDELQAVLVVNGQSIPVIVRAKREGKRGDCTGCVFDSAGECLDPRVGTNCQGIIWKVRACPA